MNAPEDEVQTEVRRLRERQRGPLRRANEMIEKAAERLGLLFVGCLIAYFGWHWGKSFHQPIGDKPISSLTLNEIGSNLFAGLVILISLVIAGKVAFAKGSDRDRALQDQAHKNVADRKRSEAAYAKGKIWGVINDPNFSSSKHRVLGVTILVATFAFLALIFYLVGRAH
jgi:hypothetical protein